MSRRQNNHSSFRFKGGRDNYRRGLHNSRSQYDDCNQDSRFGDHSLDSRFDDSNQDARFGDRSLDSRFNEREFSERDDRGLDSQGEYHRPVLMEDFDDPLTDNTDNYQDDRYNDSFNDKNQDYSYTETNSGRFQDNAVADERYISDAYDQNDSYQDDFYSGNNDQYGGYDKYDELENRQYRDDRHGDDRRSHYNQDNYNSNQRYSDHLDDIARETSYQDSQRNEDYRYENRSNNRSGDQRNYKNERDGRFSRGADNKDASTFQRPQPRTLSNDRQHKHVTTKGRSRSRDGRSSSIRKNSSSSARHGQHKSRSKERDTKKTTHSSSDNKNKLSQDNNNKSSHENKSKSSYKSDNTASKSKQQISKSSTKQISHSTKSNNRKDSKPSHVGSNKISGKENLKKSNTPRKRTSSEKGKSSAQRDKDSKKGNDRDSIPKSSNKSGLTNRSPQKKPNSKTPTRRRTVSNENRKRVDSGKEHFDRASVSRSVFDVKLDHSRQRSTGRSSEVPHREEEVRHHDDDVLSIFADDDRFYWETNTMLKDNTDRTQRKDEQWDQQENRQYYADDIYTHNDDKEKYDTNTRLRSAVGSHSRQNRNFSNSRNFRNRGKFGQNRTGFYKKKRVIDLKQNLSINKFAYRGPRAQNHTKSDRDHHNETRENYNDDFSQRNNQTGRFDNKSDRFSNLRTENKNLRVSGHKEKYRSRTSSKGRTSRNDGHGNKKYDPRGDHRDNRRGDKLSANDGPNYNENIENLEYDENRFDNENKKSSYYREEKIDYNQDFLNNDRENMNVNETGQQIIFIPNPDFHGNVDINPDMGDNQGKLQQLPLHMLPQNMAQEGAQGSDQLIFIPFVNNQLQPDSAVPIQLNNEGQMVQPQIPEKSQHDKDRFSEPKSKTKKPVKKGLSNEQRALMRKKLILKRRQRLEQEIEQKVLKKLLGTAGKLNLADTGSNVKKPLKRLSPPKRNIPGKKVMKRATSGLEDVSDEDADKYDDVSDLESISDDEDITKQKGATRKSFRKPGEPRVNQNPQTVDDVRRVVEKNVSQKVREAKEKAGGKVPRGRKRTVYEVLDDDVKDKKKTIKMDGKKLERPGMSGKPSRGHRSMSPLQITVNNEKFSNTSKRPKSKSSSSRDEDDEIQNRRKRKGHSRDRNIQKRGRDYDDYSDDYYTDENDDDEYDSDGRDRGRNRSNRSDGKYGRRTGNKLHEKERESIRKEYNRENRRRVSPRDDHRGSQGYQNERRDNWRRNSPSRWQDNRNKDYMPQNKTNNNAQNYQYVQQHNQIQAPPFPPQILTSQSQNVALPVQSNISLVNAGNSVDPSLPPVLNVPQLSQSNVGMHPDMSLPPPQVSGMGNQSSIPQVSYQQTLQSQPLQNQVLQQQQLQQATLQQLQQTQLQQQQTQQQLLQLQQQQQQQQQQQHALLNSNNQLNNSNVLNQGLYQQPTQQNSLASTSYSVANQQTNIQTIRPLQSVQQNVSSQGNLVQVHDQLNQGTLTTQVQPSQYSKDKSAVTQQSSRPQTARSQAVQPQQAQYKAVTGVIGTISKGSNVQQQSMPQVNIPVAAIQPKPLLPLAGNQTAGRGVGAQFRGESFVGNDHNTYRSRPGYDNSQVNRSHMVSSQSGNYSNRASTSGNNKQNDDRSNRSIGYDRRSGEAQSRDTTNDYDRRIRETQSRDTSNDYDRRIRETQSRDTTSGYDRRSGISQSRDLTGRSSQSNRPSTSYRRDADSESDDDDVGQLLCMKCDKVYLSKKVMRKHARWHDEVAAGQHDVRCDKCELAFLTTSVLDEHVAEKHTLDSWNCYLCDVTFSHSSSLVRHFQRENHAYLSENKYSCPICSNEFPTVKMLSHHKQTHQIVKNPTTRRY